MKVLKCLGLRHPAGIVFVIVLLFIASRSLYAAPGTKIDEETIKKIIVSHIEHNMPWSKGSMRVEFSSAVSAGVDLVGENITWRVLTDRNEDFIGYSTFTIRFYSRAVFLREENVRVKLEVLKDVVISSRFLRKGVELGSGDVKITRKWFDRTTPNIINDVAEVVGKTLTAQVRQNEEIGRDMLQESLMVKRGKLVRVVLEKGALSVSTMGLSQQDGTSGELIKVKNMESKKIIYAKVIGESLVQVEY